MRVRGYRPAVYVVSTSTAGLVLAAIMSVLPSPWSGWPVVSGVARGLFLLPVDVRARGAWRPAPCAAARASVDLRLAASHVDTERASVYDGGMSLMMGYKGSTGRWTGVLRDGTEIVFECGHSHANRGSGQANASSCIELHLYATRRCYFADQLVSREQRHEETARRLGARIEAGSLVAAARERVERLRELVGGREVVEAGARGRVRLDVTGALYGGFPYGPIPE